MQSSVCTSLCSIKHCWMETRRLTERVSYSLRRQNLPRLPLPPFQSLQQKTMRHLWIQTIPPSTQKSGRKGRSRKTIRHCISVPLNNLMTIQGTYRRFVPSRRRKRTMEMETWRMKINRREKKGRTQSPTHSEYSVSQ